MFRYTTKILLVNFVSIIAINSFANPTETNTLFIATGSMSDSTGMHPLVGTSKDAKTWAYDRNLAQNFLGNISSVACKGHACSIVGDFQTQDHKVFGPLIAVTKDAGVNWNFPATITNDAVISIQPMSSWFNSASCSASNCIAVGIYRKSTDAIHYQPLLALSKDGENWLYPESFYQAALPQPMFSAYFRNASCSDKTCIAVGVYNENSADAAEQKPLLAISKDGGKTWNYPANIHAKTSLPKTFRLGSFTNASCSNDICIASGSYAEKEDALETKPLLAMSNDGGNVWIYPDSINSSLPSEFKTGDLNASTSCSGKLCIATGLFHDGKKPRPLLAMTQDAGKTWTYPKDIYSAWVPSQNPASYLDGGASCNEEVCAIGGSYSDGVQTFPMIASTQDGGKTWHYFNEVLSFFRLPILFRSGQLNSRAACNGDVCMLSGSYYDGQRKPLLAVSYDKGISWEYPQQIYANEILPKNFNEGYLGGVGIDR